MKYIIQPRQPYTEDDKEYNIKPRLVYCKYCKTKFVTNLPGPKCGNCRANLITVVSRDELAG